MDIKQEAKIYYKRKDIQKALLFSATDREVVPTYSTDSFGKRPDMLQYENDIANLAAKGAIAFHCSEERWNNPLELSTGLTQQQLDELRVGWDLILDVDGKIEYSKIVTELLIEALHFHNIRNFGLKFSGNKGFHIGLAYEAFPKKLNNLFIKNFFPQGPRIIASYLKELIKKPLRERLQELETLKEISEKAKKPLADLLIRKEGKEEFNPFSIVEIDTVLIASRHLFRMPYSLHEKTGLASIVFRPGQLKDFVPEWAKPSRVIPKPFIPKPEESEAKQLLLQALDWQARQRQEKKEEQILGRRQIRPIEIIAKDLSEDLFPPCIRNALKGIKQDGRKRALFILLSFFKSLKIEKQEIEKRIEEWNKLNYKPLREGYVKSQIVWFEKQKQMLPPNFDNEIYKSIGIYEEDNLCKKTKNPVNYVLFRLRMKQEQEKRTKKTRKKKF